MQAGLPHLRLLPQLRQLLLNPFTANRIASGKLISAVPLQ